MSGKRATIHEVAERAGVSHQTVSRYLRHNGGLKPATLARVEAAIDELDYRPSLVARSMRTRRTGRIAILLPTTTHLLLPLRLLTAASGAAHDAGFLVDLIVLEGSADHRGERAREVADTGGFEGILALASLGERSAGWNVPAVVTVADYDDELHGLGALADATACGEVVRVLADLGHRRFLHLAGHPDFASARNRRRTFLETVAELGLSGEVRECRWSGRRAYAAVRDLPDDAGCTAVVAANDVLAMGAVRACLERGWRVPGDISVIGWDDEFLGRFATPSLSTVAVDRERQGRDAMHRLIALMRGTEPPPADPASLHSIVLRESTGPAPKD